MPTSAVFPKWQLMWDSLWVRQWVKHCQILMISSPHLKNRVCFDRLFAWPADWPTSVVFLKWQLIWASLPVRRWVKNCQILIIISPHLKNCVFHSYWLLIFLFTEYEVIKDQPGDSYYVRAMFDRLPDPQAGPHQLSFRKDDILFIDNTMYNGVPGHWSAWLVDLGKQNLYGISKYFRLVNTVHHFRLKRAKVFEFLVLESFDLIQ